jgi:hypothetical protein
MESHDASGAMADRSQDALMPLEVGGECGNKAICVACFEEAEQRHVVVERGLELAGPEAQELIAHPLLAVSELAEQVKCDRIVTGLDNVRVELIIRLDKRIRVVDVHCGALAFECGAELSEGLGIETSVANDPRDRGTFDRLAHLDEVLHLTRRHRCNNSALAGRQNEELFRRQPEECLVHGCAADAQGFTDLPLAEQLTSHEVATNDQTLGVQVSAFSARCRGVFGHKA